MNFSEAISINPEVVFKEIEGESVLLHLQDGSYFGLDEIGTHIWQLILEHGSLDVVLEQLLSEYDATPEEIRGDLEKLVGELADKRLLILEAPESD